MILTETKLTFEKNKHYGNWYVIDHTHVMHIHDNEHSFHLLRESYSASCGNVLRSTRNISRRCVVRMQGVDGRCLGCRCGCRCDGGVDIAAAGG